ncbi:MAG: glycosyltransferase family 4 protein [Thermaurantimonas sp.]|uniref:glycosyltransferase family 4 protein n=1 Tax=Thermaurantimonas sp. TaxID=2681568 RepID=UPI00391D6457
MTSIALVVNTFPTLSESFIVNKVRLLADLGFKVTIIIHKKQAESIPQDLIGRVRVLTAPSAYPLVKRILHIIYAFCLNFESFYLLWRQCKCSDLLHRFKILELYTPFAGCNFDIIHFSFSGIGVAYLPLMNFLKKKSRLYVSCRGHAEQIRPLFDLERRKKLNELFDVVDRVHCVSDDMVTTCVTYGLDRSKAFVNRPAIDPALFSPIKGHNATIKQQKERDEERCIPFRILTVGRLHWKKGLDTLIQAIRILNEKNLNLHLDIVGEGPEREKLVFLAHQLGLSEIVFFHGALNQFHVRDFLAQAQVFVHPSLSEGISNAVMEAMAMELPIVCTDAGGMSELIVHEYNGLIVPILNPAALAEAITRLYQSFELRLRLGQSARQTILKDFTLERQGRIFANEYALATCSYS